MARKREYRDWTIDDFNTVDAARRDIQATRDAASEEGGPSFSMVPSSKTCRPNVLLDEVSVPPSQPLDPDVVPFKPQPSRKTGGWTAERQRCFIESLAETGSVHLASRYSGLTARSAYSLRVRSQEFARAWDVALQLAVGRLSALALDRAIHGRVEQFYVEGVLAGEKRLPSDRLLMWLLSRLDPKRFATPWERGKADAADPQAEAHRGFAEKLAELTDTPESNEPITQWDDPS